MGFIRFNHVLVVEFRRFCLLVVATLVLARPPYAVNTQLRQANDEDDDDCDDNADGGLCARHARRFFCVSSER